MVMAPSFTRSSTRGYTMVFLLVGMTVMAVLIAAILPLASAEVQRGKEQELIFRGLQYAEGIRNFKRRYGRYPSSLKEMYTVRPRTVRKLWKDPITNSDDWGLITVTTGAPGQGLPVSGPGGVPPGGSGPRPLPTPSPTPTPSFGGLTGMAGAPPAGPITGVYSKSKKKSFKIYQDRDVYADWRFTEASLLGAGVAPPSGSVPVPGPGIPQPPQKPPLGQ
jgi:type II secretory pathway pseudopilin PulG